MFNKNKAGLSLGILLAFFHLLWVLAVALGLAQALLNYTLNINFISDSQIITNVNFGMAIIGIITSFICGYITGWLFAMVWNWFAPTPTLQ